MPEKINLTGRWRFEENFGFGKDNGYAEINQRGKHLKGVLRFSEQIDGEETFIVKQEIAGKINGTKIDLKSHSCEILFRIPGPVSFCLTGRLSGTAAILKGPVAHLLWNAKVIKPLI